MQVDAESVRMGSFRSRMRRVKAQGSRVRGQGSRSSRFNSFGAKIRELLW